MSSSSGHYNQIAACGRMPAPPKSGWPTRVCYLPKGHAGRCEFSPERPAASQLGKAIDAGLLDAELPVCAGVLVNPRPKGDTVLDCATGDDPVLCHLCGKDTSIAMISRHLIDEHGFDPDEIDTARVVIKDDDAES